MRKNISSLVFTVVCIATLVACNPGTPTTPITPPTKTQTSSNQVSPTTAPPPPTPTQPMLCADVSTPPPAVPGSIAVPDASVAILWRPSFTPRWVASSPDGRILATTDIGDSIFELKPDGSLAVAFRCPGEVFESFAAASDGALWFVSRDQSSIYRVALDGTIHRFPHNGSRYLEAGLDGSVYALERGLVRIDPNGNQKIITTELTSNKFDIGPQGEIVARRGPDIVRVSESGEFTVIATGYGPENGLAFGPDGLLYVIHWTGIQVIDLETGKLNSIPWLDNSQLGESGTFAPDGRLLIYNPNAGVYAIDFASQTISPYHEIFSNSWAMAQNPNDAVYIAFGNELEDGQTIIYRVLDERTLELVASVPYAFERDMIFDDQGMGYLAVTNTARVGAIFRFDPSSGAIEEYWRTQCNASTLALNPQTGRVWWDDCSGYYSLDEDGKLIMIPGVPNGTNTSLAITPDGEFYVVTFFPRTDMSLPFEHRLFRWDGTAWQEIADLTQSDSRITISTVVACPDGHIYTVESLDASHLPRQGDSTFNAVRRLEPDGSLTLIGFDFSYDGLAADCDRTTGRILFTSGVGIFTLTPP